LLHPGTLLRKSAAIARVARAHQVCRQLPPLLRVRGLAACLGFKDPRGEAQVRPPHELLHQVQQHAAWVFGRGSIYRAKAAWRSAAWCGVGLEGRS
jgi:hypothetical protein